MTNIWFQSAGRDRGIAPMKRSNGRTRVTSFVLVWPPTGHVMADDHSQLEALFADKKRKRKVGDLVSMDCKRESVRGRQPKGTQEHQRNRASKRLLPLPPLQAMPTSKQQNAPGKRLASKTERRSLERSSKRTTEGYRVYTWDELVGDQPQRFPPGGSCPFDCNCCF